MGKEKLIDELNDIQAYINQSMQDDYLEYEDYITFRQEFCSNRNDLKLLLTRLSGWIEADKHLSESAV